MGGNSDATLRGLVQAALVLLVLFVAGFATGVALAQDSDPAAAIAAPVGSGGATAAADPREPLLR